MRYQLGSIRFAVALLVFAFALGADFSHAAESTGPDASRSTAGDLEDHEAHSKDPEDLTTGSEDLDDFTVDAEQLEDHEAGSANPASMVTDSGELEEHEAQSRNLTDLAETRPDVGAEDIEMPGQADWAPSTDPDIIRARKDLRQAQKRARRAREVYGRAQQNDYPRGEPRLRINREYDAAMQALEEAKRAVEAVQ